MNRPPLRLTSLQSRVHHPLHAALAAALARALDEPVEPVLDADWSVTRGQLRAGEITLGTVCTPYYLADQAGPAPAWRLLGALVPRGEGGPRYRALVVVDAASGFTDPAQLAGTRVAFNEPMSLSGHLALRVWLAERGTPRDFFGALAESGGHRASLRALAAGAVDAACLDSTIAAYLRRHRPAARAAVRVLDQVVDLPHPVLVAHRALGAARLAALAEAVPRLGDDPAFRAALARDEFAGIAPVTDADLAPLAARLAGAAGVRIAAETTDLRGI